MSYVAHRRKSWRAVSAGGGGAVSFSDDFNRASNDNLGANWTEANGVWSIINNTQLHAEEGGFAEQVLIYSGQACNGINQYVKFDLVSVNGGNSSPGVVFRYQNSTTEFYYIRLDLGNSLMRVYHTTQVDGTITEIGSASFSASAGNTYGFTCSGTGNNVVWRVWANPSGTPTAADNWGGAAGATVTDDPGANNVDAGTFVGLYDTHNIATTFDNFFGGDIPE